MTCCNLTMYIATSSARQIMLSSSPLRLHTQQQHTTARTNCKRIVLLLLLLLLTQSFR